MGERKYRICERCVMDTSDSQIQFNEKGVCNHCRNYDEKIKKRVFKGENGKRKLDSIVKEVKESGKNKKYDCIIGVSGGADSMYTVHLAKEVGLRPLIVHLDNGWNSRIATKNITNVLKKLDLDLETYVIDWEEFKDLQVAYLKASVIDIEALTDHAIKATLYKTANKQNIGYILTGTNVLTEGIMGSGWAHNKSDYINIKDIHDRFGKVELKTFPLLKLSERILYQIVKKIKTIEVLNYVPYEREDIKKLLEEEYGWEDYGRKHGESLFTRFYQEYILPEKFGVDKRKAHFSALICAGQMTREDALEKLKEPLYRDESELKKEKEFVLRKLGLSNGEFEEIMKLPVKHHEEYKSGDRQLRILRKAYLKVNGGE